MSDFFELLGQPRRPWLDTEALKQSFRARSLAVHPDRVHEADAATRTQATENYAVLNQAFTALANPKDRLRHLLELETGRPPGGIQSAPEAAMELFVQIGQLCRELDAFLAEKARGDSPMVRARLFTVALGWMDRVAEMQGRLAGRREALHAELAMMNEVWVGAADVKDVGARSAALPLGRIEAIYRELGFLQRWEGQLQERHVQLAV